jgi:hypothetical protein
VNFVRLVLTLSLLEILSNTLINLQTATGKIRNYQLVVGSTLLLNFPLSYIALELGCPPEATLVVALFVGVCCLLLRLLFLRKMVGLSMLGYLKNVCLNVLGVFTVVVVPTSVVHRLVPFTGWAHFFAVGLTSVVVSLFAILYIGCTKSERAFIMGKIAAVKKKLGL